MKSNYKKIGAYVERENLKNTNGTVTELLGINIDKYFMPSVANVVGTDLTKYKVVKKGQFACNRMHVGRDYRLPIALSKSEDDFLVSPAYDVFQIKDETKLMPEYLMMWFTRSEFDRNAWFHTDTDVRGKLGWDSFCNMELPVPSIEKQREIVAEYNTVVDRIKLNEELNKKLEETAQTLYKHWFVDFEEDNFISVGNLITPQKGRNITRSEAINGDYPVIAGGKLPSCYHNNFNTKSPVVTISASGANAGFVSLFLGNVWAADCSYIDQEVTQNVFFFYCCLKVNESLLMSKQIGTGQPHIYPEHISTIPIFNYNENKCRDFNSLTEKLFYYIDINKIIIQRLNKIEELLLSRMTKV